MLQTYNLLDNFILPFIYKTIDTLWNDITDISVRYYVSWNNLFLYVHVEVVNVQFIG